MPFGGDKRDRTADLLNAIDGRGSVRQGQALQKEKTLKCKGFLLIFPFRALYFSASCALDLMIVLYIFVTIMQAPPLLYFGFTSTNLDSL